MKLIKLTLSEFEQHIKEYMEQTRPEPEVLESNQNTYVRKLSFEEKYGYRVLLGMYGAYPDPEQAIIISE